MEAERWTKIDRLLDRAMERPPEMRADFLAIACEGDEDLRREVESLLKTQWASEPFLSLPALDLAARCLARDREASLVGRRLGPYQVISVLGVGGMGEVYLAHDERLNRKLALKLLPEQFTRDAARLRRFERESQTASALNHPNIITIYDIGRIEDQHFIAAEYVEGRTLRELLADGPLEATAVIEIGLQIASALAVTHEAGIIHRDLKPENVMRRKDGYIKVLDFGLARVTERQPATDDFSRTGEGLVLGTISYMSPEQALGDEMDCRSDLFSLGILLYELVTGSQPFTGNTPISIANNIIHHRPPPLERAQPDLPPAMGQIITRLLEKDRSRRYQTADDLRSDLKRLQLALDSGEVAAARLGASSLLRSRIGNRFLVIALVIALLLAGQAAWRYFRLANRRAAINWNDARFSAVTDMLGRETGACISPDGEWVVYCRPVNAQWDIFRQHIGASNAINLTNHPAQDGDPAISPDGEQIAFQSTRDGGGILVMGATGDGLRRVTSEGRDPDWSPDGREIVYSTIGGGVVLSRESIGGQLWVVDVGTGAKRRIDAGPDAVQPKWSPHGHRIACCGVGAGERRGIWTIPAGGGEPVTVISNEYLNTSPIWFPDGTYLYFNSNSNGRLGIWRVPIDEQTGRTLGEPELVPTQASNSYELSIAADGRRMAYTSNRELANIFRVPFDARRAVVTGEPIQITFSGRRFLQLSPSPDGESVAYYSYGDPQFDLFVTRVDGPETRQLTNDPARDWSPRWSPDGKRLAFFSNLSGKYEVWTINPNGGDRQQVTFSEPDQPGFVLPGWSPKGTELFLSLRNGGGFIMDMTRPWNQQALFEFPPTPDEGGKKTWYFPYNWSPDGSKIIGSIRTDGSKPQQLVVYDLATRRYEHILKDGDVGFWLNDSRRVVYNTSCGMPNSNQAIYIVDTQSRKPKLVHSLPNLSLEDPVLSRDNKWLFYAATSLEEDIWMISLK